MVQDIKKVKKSLLLNEIERVFYNFLCFQKKMSSILNKSKDDFDLIKQIKIMEFSRSPIFYINFENLIYFSEELADLVEDQYLRIENSLKKSILEFTRKFFNHSFNFGNLKEKYFRIGFYNLPNWKSIRILGNYNYGKLVCTIGKIVRIIESELKLIIGSFRCLNNNCKNRIKLAQDFTQYSEPKICLACKSSDSWEIITEESIFIEIQKIKIQEMDVDTKEKRAPLLLDAFLVDIASNLFALGSKCVFTGCIVPLPLKKISFVNRYLDLKPLNENLSLNLVVGSLFYPALLVNHVFCVPTNFDFKNYKKYNSLFLKKKIKILNMNGKNMITRLKEWFPTVDNNEWLSSNKIEKYDHMKMSILLMLIGGVDRENSKNQWYRSNINLSIIHFPDNNFKNLFSDIKNLNPEIVYANGLTSSVTGLTAAVVRDWDTTSLCIESGLFVSKNKKCCVIENFHNLDYSMQKLIVDCMEKQEFRLNKAEMKLALESKITVLAISELNKEDIFDINSFSRTNFFDKNFLKKFDLNFIFFPENNIKTDFSFSKKYISFNKTRTKKNDKWPIQLYLSFVKNLSPSIDSDSYKFILKIYLFLKKNFSIQTGTDINVTSRHLEILLRLSEAFGKLLMSLKIQKFHIKAAARMIYSSFYFFNDARGQKKNDLSVEIKKQGTPDKLKKLMRIKFYEFNFISKKIMLIIGTVYDRNLFGVSFSKLVRTLFFFYSRNNKKYIGIKKLKKLIKIFKRMVFIDKNLFIPKVSNIYASIENCLILSKI